MSGKNYLIEPPPKDNGIEPFFRVVYVIDVGASDSLKAAKLVYRIMTDPDSIPPVLEVMDCKGKVSKIDLSKKFHKERSAV